MPIFDFKCRECGHKFDLIISVENKDKAICPQCGAENPQQLLSVFSTPRAVNPAAGCNGCSSAGSGG